MGVSRVTSSSDDFDLECVWRCHDGSASERDRKSTRLNSSHSQISYAVFCLKKKIMTVAAIMGGLLPIMWTTGTGADVMKRIAAPMIGGIVSSTILTLIVIPVLYFLWRHGAVSPSGPPEVEEAAPYEVDLP